MSFYEVLVEEEPRKCLMKLDSSIQEKMIKRIARMRNEPPGRHLRHGLDFFVEEVGQYRIIYTLEEKMKVIYFIGDHKEYERWFRRKIIG